MINRFFILSILILTNFTWLHSQPLKDIPVQKFSYPLNSRNTEYNPMISPNGRYIVFQSDRPGGEGGMDIWLSENKNFINRVAEPIWSDPINFKELNSKSFEGLFSIRFDGDGNPLELFFTSYAGKDSGRSGFDGLNIYYSRKNKMTGKWSLPVHISEVNSMYEDKMPAISQDGTKLVFVSNRPGGVGGMDLWISYRDMENQTWSKPVNLGKSVNTNSNEIMPYFHYDGVSLYFSSDKGDELGKFHFFGSDIDNNIFSESYSLGKPFNSESDDEGISCTSDGLWIYYTSNRPGGEGQFDIYRAQFPEDMHRSYDFRFHGLVLDGAEEKMIGLNSTIKIFSDEKFAIVLTSNRIGGDLTKADEINFDTSLKTGKFYKVEVSAPGYYPVELKLDLRGNVGKGKSQYTKIILYPVKKDSENITKTKDPIKVDSDSSDYLINVMDSASKLPISNSQLTLFTEKNRAGQLISGERGVFRAKTIPDENFEVMASADGYAKETVLIDRKASDFIKNRKLIIYLNKLSETADVYKYKIYFQFNEYRLSEENKKMLARVSDYLKKNPSDKIEIGGHTDNIAGKDFNMRLSKKRAEIVRQYLTKMGIQKERIQVQAYWYSKPDAENSTEVGRAKNRRVDFKRIK